MPKINPIHSPPVTVSTQPVKVEKQAQTKRAVQQDVRAGSARSKLQGLAFQAGLKFPDLNGKTKEESIALRSDRRQRLNAVRKQQNLETIVARSEQFCHDTDVTDTVDPDWYFSFLELAENINSPSMQELWAKILAGEVSHPNSFSRESLFVLKKMTQANANKLKAACSLMSRGYKNNSAHIVYGFSRKPSLFSLLKPKTRVLPLSKYGLPYGDIVSLVDLGILLPGELESGEWPVDEAIPQFYLGKKYHLKATESGVVLNYYKFSDIGLELIKLIANEPKPDYFSDLSQILEQAFSIST